MKVEENKPVVKKEFKPISITLTFETEREIEFFYHLFGNTNFEEAIQIVNKNCGKSKKISTDEKHLQKGMNDIFNILENHYFYD